MRNILLHRTEIIHKRCEAVMRCARRERMSGVIQAFKESGLANK